MSSRQEVRREGPTLMYNCVICAAVEGDSTAADDTAEEVAVKPVEGSIDESSAVMKMKQEDVVSTV